MFFVSEEFLRKYEEGQAIEQTIDVAVPVGQELFADTGGKRAYNRKKNQAPNSPASSDSEVQSQGGSSSG